MPESALNDAVFEPDGRRRPLVIATCSAGKRVRGGAAAATLPRARQSAVERAWLETISAERALAPARSVYKGRAFATTRKAADQCGARFGVLSAGLGYVRDDTPIPGYDLTVRPGGPGSVLDRVEGAFSPAAWWSALAAGPFGADLAADLHASSLTLVCLSRSYLSLVADDLADFAARRPEGLRLFGMSLERHVPAVLRPALMPYDGRLESVGASGTRSDFAARALSDFVAHVLPWGGRDVAADAAAVRRRLEGAAHPKRRSARRVDDEAVKAGIRALGRAHGGGESLLTRFRRETGLSCEQRRFAALARAVRAEPRA